jgi:hypothetical protein
MSVSISHPYHFHQWTKGHITCTFSRRGKEGRKEGRKEMNIEQSTVNVEH